jgi:hypothetical protein
MSSGKGLATRTQENVMKAIVSSLVALSVLTGVAVAPAAAFDAKRFWDQQSASQGN